MGEHTPQRPLTGGSASRSLAEGRGKSPAASAAGKLAGASKLGAVTDKAGLAGDLLQKEAVSGTKNTIKTVATDAAKGAATGGGVPGAVKGAALGLAKTKLGRRIMIGLGVLVAVLVLAAPVATVSVVGAVASSLVSGDANQSKTAVEAAGYDADDLTQVKAIASANDLSWEIVLSLREVEDKPQWKHLRAALNAAGARGIGAGGVYNEDGLAPGKSDDEKKAAKKERKAYLAGLRDYGLSKQDAQTVYETALVYHFGTAGKCEAPSGPSGTVTGDSFVYKGVTYDAKQVAVMKGIIGIAKTMFPNHQKKAAVVGLITAAVESGYRNYANDGVIGPEDGSFLEATRQGYSKLAYSLTLDHDAVGSDHASVGIMQQQATYSWGDIPGSTWANDYKGVIERLMTPTFAAASFFTRMSGIAGWANEKPGVVAQSVQISAYPDRYAQKVGLAKAVWKQYAAETPAASMPAGIDWNGSVDTDDGTGTSANPCNTGGAGIPSGTDQELAQEIMAATAAGDILWFGNADRNQVVAYANGDKISEACTIDTRIFQIILMADDIFHRLSVNSLNRRCNGTTEGLGKASLHWQGKAVDFGNLGGTATTGADANSIIMIKAFDKVAPPGAGVGQLGCGGRGRVTADLNEFADSCTHLHLDLGPTDDPLKMNGTTE